MIKTLDGITHIQQRAEMYIGNTEYSTALFKEVFDNQKDEILAGRCNRIDIFLIKDSNGNLWNIFRDWSNGIPLTSSELPGKDIPIEICVSLNTSGKFDKTNDNSEYLIAAGQNGLGLKAVNALSSYLYITTKAHDKDNNYWEYFFQNGKFISKRLVKIKTNEFEESFGTEVKFLPNPKYFQNPIPNEDIIMKDLLVSKYALGDTITINFNGHPINNTYYEDFIKDIEEIITAKSNFKETRESCKIDIALCENINDGKVFQGIVNLLSSNEGTHCNLCFNLIKNKLFTIAEKKKKHVQINDLLIPIKVLCNLELRDPRFESQTKVKLANRNNELQLLIEPVIDQLIKNNSSFFDKVIDKAEEYRINLESSKVSKKTKAKGGKVKVHGLKDCSCKDPNLTTLYLVEGFSAEGKLLECRSPVYDALLALRGKLLNVIHDKVSKGKIMENDVIKNIAAALGYKLFQEVDPTLCRYRDIMIMSDADPDGERLSQKINLIKNNICYH